MKNTCKFYYEEEFVDDLIYFNEKYGDEFVCDGDRMEVTASFNRGLN